MWSKIVGITAIGIVIVVVLFAIVLHALEWYLNPVEFSERNDVVQGVAPIIQAFAVFAGLIGIYFTWSNSDRQLRVAREGQITDRFTRAIEQLGATDDKGEKRLEMRLGGIYALERIATDSPERDYSTVMQVLMAYVRENAPLDSEKHANQNRENKTGSEPAESVNQDSTVRPKIPADIQAILDVLQRLKRLEEKGLVLTLQHIFIDLKESNLSGARLRKANLFNANLFKADLFRADLFQADLFRADLSGAKLSGANLSGTNLSGTNLRDAKLRDAKLPGAKLSRANLSEADLFRADLHRTNLFKADLIKVNLSEADLFRAYLFGANLSRADLSRAYLTGADLTGADLTGADLSEAKGLTKGQLASARGHASTHLSPGYKRPESW